MHRRIVCSLLIAVILGLTVTPGPAAAQTFRGVEFPQGAASFADAVVAYAPDLRHPLRSDVKHPGEALGPPDDVTGIPAEYVSLGNGGSLTLRFVNNALTSSGNADKDLWIFEVGPLVEDTSIAISRDGVAWIEVGTVAGSTSGLDIDPFVPDPTVKYSFVRLIDIATEDFDTGNTAGADIDAVGAISTVVRPADTTAPVVTVPAGLTAEATGPGGAAVAFAASALDAVDGAIAPTCTPASGAPFPLGATPVTCKATDDAGNTGSAGFALTVVDTTAPEITVSVDVTAEATSAAGATVTFGAATASDLVDSDPTPGCDAESGDLFPIGTTTVTCTATDAAGNTGDASFAITVEDTTAPRITVPADVTAEATSAGGAAVVYDSATAFDLVDGAVAPTCAPASGTTFPLGTVTVVCAAIDAAGNTGSTGFHVTVRDTTAPALTLPGALEAEAAGATGATIAYEASAHDIVDGPVAPACDPPSGATFPLGPSSVDCTAADAAGNSASGGFAVTVVDTTAPALTVPADFAVEATGPAGAAVGYEAAAMDAVDGAVTATCAPPSGGTFPLGTTAVGCTATDAAGNSASAGFAVAVVDSTPPVVTVPAGVTVAASSPAGAAVEFAASAADLVDGALPVACSAASGTTFPVGSSTVTCGAADAAGNQGGASFVVTVVAPAYGICPLFDQSKAVKAGAVKPIRVQLCDAAGNNLSSPEIVLHAAGLVHVDGTPSAQVEDPGRSNPDHNFRYDAGAYVFNLDTGGLTSGTWKLLFTVNGYATVYDVTFDIR